MRPAFFAAASDSAVTWAAVSPNAGVIPLTWYQRAPANTDGQSMLPGVTWLIADAARSYSTLLARGAAPSSAK